MRPTDEQVRALARFAMRVLNGAIEEEYVGEVNAEAVIHTAGEEGLFRMLTPDTALVDVPDWLLEAAGQHTLTEDASNGTGD